MGQRFDCEERMRINVYGEELTDECAVVSKVVTDNQFGTRTFYGVRVFLKSPDVLHDEAEDDNRSAITFWVPWSQPPINLAPEQGYAFEYVRTVLDNLKVQLGVAMDLAKRGGGEKL